MSYAAANESGDHWPWWEQQQQQPLLFVIIKLSSSIFILSKPATQNPHIFDWQMSA